MKRPSRSPEQSKPPERKLTPVMEQFFRAKDQYPDAILFFRLGDFYEMFYEDAVLAARLLELTLTSRSKSGDGDPIPMAGVPHHAATGYIARLLAVGQCVALCEQMADPSQVKGIVPREVVRVITPALATDPEAMDPRSDQWLLALAENPAGQVGVAALELSRKAVRLAVLPDQAAVFAELVRMDPREILVPEDCPQWEPRVRDLLPNAAVRIVASVNPGASLETNLSPEARRAASEQSPVAQLALGAVLHYAQAAHPKQTLTFHQLDKFEPRGTLGLDETAVRNLELVRTMRGDREGSLLAILDETRTSMGARLLRRRLLEPLCDVAPIRRRHDEVELFVLNSPAADQLREILRTVLDLERLASRVELGVATPRDLGGIRQCLVKVHELGEVLVVLGRGDLSQAAAGLVPRDELPQLRDELLAALSDEPPAIATVGGIFRDGYNVRIDELRTLTSRGKDLILELEDRERTRTGISSLKIRYTRVFGYYIEITKSNLGAVPADYQRKQTIAGGERYSTPELDELQGKILNAEEKLVVLENELFVELRLRVGALATELRALAQAIARIDVATGLAEGARRHQYTRPVVDDSLDLELEESRHPVVERLSAAGAFVANDVVLRADAARFWMITGPNMAGKSTFMRQVALCALMAQSGMFVPAKRARIGLVDKIFTRVGASDDLGRGQSTFMVEMKETAAILGGVSERSLVVLDEIGRGTSTYDGLAIAQAVAEHLHDIARCRVLFATHYHELAALAAERKSLANYNASAREHQGDVVFLHRILQGAANRSYGVAVAKLAGLPESSLARARQLLQDLETRAEEARTLAPNVRSRGRQIGLFEQATETSEPEALRLLRAAELDRMTPLDALVLLSRLKSLL